MVLEFTHKLSDGTFTEGEMFELSCELSRPDVPVTWLKNRKPLTPSDRIRILCERYRHVLQIMEAIPEDEGEYTLLLPNNTETSAVIKVKGQTQLFLYWMLSYAKFPSLSVCFFLFENFVKTEFLVGLVNLIFLFHFQRIRFKFHCCRYWQK